LDKPDIEAQRIARLIAGLDDEQFRVREQASSELEVAGSAVLPLLERALSQGVSPEQKFRITRLLASIRREAQRPEGEPLRRLRAIGILERIDSRAAGAMLDEFAAGPPDTTETLEAQSALARRKSGDFRSEKR
jgi:hypothetical protein